MIGKAIPIVVLVLACAIALWRDAPYAAIPFVIITLSWVITRMWITDTGKHAVTQETDAKRERPLASGVAIGMIALPLLALVTPFLDFAAYTGFPGQLFIGYVLALAGLLVFWRSHADLGSMWSAHLEIREGHRLVTSGIYRHMRHPMYTAIFLITLSQLFVLENWIAGAAGFVTFAVLYALRIGPEENMMADQFGADWQAYAAKTPRLLPGLNI